MDQEILYRNLFEHAGDAIFIVGMDGGIMEMNQEAVRRHGFSRSEMLRMWVNDIDTPEHASLASERIATILENGAACFESVHRIKDDGCIPVEVNARLIDFGGKPAILAVARDITDRKKADDLLHRQNEYLLALHETTLGLISRHDINNLLRDIITRAAKFMNTEHGYIYLLNKETDEMIIQVQLGIFDSFEHHPLRRGEGMAGHVWECGRLCHVDNYRDWPGRLHDPKRDLLHAMTGVPLTSGGEVVGVIGLAYIDENNLFDDEKTGQLSRFAQLASLALENVRLYESAQNELAERKRLESQLRHSQKMEAVGQLAGGIAHDFNNILTAIIGYTTILQMKIAGENPFKATVDQILATAERGASLTQGLLSFSRKQVSNPGRVNLNEIIERVEKLLLRLIGEDIHLKSMLSGQELPVMADSMQIEQVVMNLATNARDAMPGGGSITIKSDVVMLDSYFLTTHGFGEQGYYALLTFSDTGCGMDEETVKRIFEPFYTTKEIGKGTGLGLSIVYGIIKKHGGYITCHSSPGKGTSFAIYLPMTIDKHNHQPEYGNSMPYRGGHEVILLAEDDQTARMLSKELLEEFGYTVIETEDGCQALEKYLEYRDTIRLVMLDAIMPGMKGMDVYREIKKINPDARVLFCSGYNPDVMDNENVPDRNLHFIAKPFMPKELLMKIREVLEDAA